MLGRCGTFNITVLGEYSDLYLLTDILLLADIFQNFRTTVMRTHDLDLAYYITLPSYAFDCMLKTQIKLDTLQDPEMHIFFEWYPRWHVPMFQTVVEG